jgi:hypothetical protein
VGAAVGLVLLAQQARHVDVLGLRGVDGGPVEVALGVAVLAVACVLRGERLLDFRMVRRGGGGGGARGDQGRGRD